MPCSSPFGTMTSTETRTFYCSRFPAKLHQIVNQGNLVWKGISFNLHEI